MKLTLAEIAEAVGGQLIAPEPSLAVDAKSTRGVSAAVSAGTAADVEATSVTWDSRAVKPGALFVALPGERVDGHHFISSAIEQGAVAALVSYKMAYACPQILVKDTTEAFTQLAAYWRSKFTGTVIGITGSTGKTTTKGLVRDVLAYAGSVVATEANQNNELGVPRTLLNADANTSYVVVEMGMRGLGQIAELCKIVQPSWGIVTNVGESHRELLGSRENIALAKSELYQALPSDGIAFVNASCDYAQCVVDQGKLVERGIRMVVVSAGEPSAAGETAGSDKLGGPGELGEPFESGETCSLDIPASMQVFATDIVLNDEGHPSFLLCVKDALGSVQQVPCTLQLRGLHNVNNACMAAAVGLQAGLSLEGCARALAEAQPEEGRQSFKQTSQGALLIDDAYNASPDSMKASLDTFAALNVNGKRIAVLGDMGELGDLALEAHRSVGRMVVEAGIDSLICAGELARDIAQGAIDAGLPEENVRIMESTTDALKQVKENLRSDDAVLVKASHFMEFEKIVEGLME